MQHKINPALPGVESLRDVVSRGKLPEHLIWDYIRENTRQWCLHAYFGHTLFFLQCRAYQHALYQKEGSTLLHRQPLLLDFLRLEIARVVFEPLLHGLARFAEYDCYPTQTHAVPPFLAYAPLTFIKPTAVVPPAEVVIPDPFKSNVLDEYTRMLLHQRIFSGEGIARKADLLSQRLSIGSDQGLMGYLFVKYLQDELMMKDKRFSDPNIFLFYIRNFFFADLGLVAVMLEDTLPGKLGQKVLEYFIERVSLLCSIRHGMVEEFELNLQHPDTAHKTVNLLLSAEDLAYGEGLLETLVSQVHTSMSPLVVDTLYQRQLMYEAVQCPVHLEISPLWINVFADSANQPGLTFVTSLSNDRDLPRFSGKALLTHFLHHENIATVLLSEQGNLIHVGFSDGWNDESRALFMNYYESPMMQRTEMIETIHHMAMLDLPLASTLQHIHQKIQKQLLEQVEQYYLDRSLNTKAEDIDSIFSAMKNSGFLNILGNDPEHVRTLAFLSITSAHGLASNELLALLARDLGIAFGRPTLDRIAEQLNEFRLEYFFTSTQHTYCRAI